METGARPEGVLVFSWSRDRTLFGNRAVSWIITANEGEPGTLTFVRLRGE